MNTQKTLRTTLGIIVLKLILGFSGCNAISKDDMLDRKTAPAGFSPMQHFEISREGNYASPYGEHIHAGRYFAEIDGVYFKSADFANGALPEALQMPYFMRAKTKTSE